MPLLKTNLPLRIFSGYLLVLLILSGSVLYFSLGSFTRYHLSVAQDNLTHIARVILPDVIDSLENKSPQALNQNLDALAERTGTDLILFKADGSPMATSSANETLSADFLKQHEVQEALAGRLGESVISGRKIPKTISVALPLEDGPLPSALLHVSMSLEQTRLFLNKLRDNVIFLTFLFMLLALILAFLISRGIALPIRKLSEASLRVAGGDFNARVSLKSHGDLAALAAHFNTMTEKLAGSFHEISKQKEDLQMILSSLQQGLVMVGQDRRIKLWNNSLEMLVKSDALENRLFGEIIKSPELCHLLEDTFEHKRQGQARVLLHGRSLLTSATFLEGQNSAVLIFHDLSAFEQMEQIKRDLIVNVSHELRTPLTSIKGFLESLKESLQGENLKFVEIIDRNTERLIHIVNDLLILEEVDHPQATPPLVDTPIKPLLENILAMFAPKIANKGLLCRFSCMIENPRVMADPFKLEQLFINLIDNAYKYTEKGSIDISLHRATRKQELLLTVSDTGIGIPTEHLSRIFERFYVVDKSRSKQSGGTGLGLSIVKHIVLVHHGRIDIQSHPGQGTTFTVALPLLA